MYFGRLHHTSCCSSLACHHCCTCFATKAIDGLVWLLKATRAKANRAFLNANTPYLNPNVHQDPSPYHLSPYVVHT
ncbi:hypothetical protein K443DRAFT_574565 [Laccaria amethystina LaAM-08-1]|uniref:Uncharacterized protein n=1 Tax=Laccaria amethystina LaAM-08-1 TaxID=1095629 RepID=A0A0C9X884_9AGAR|nr:hypothetical protein K443DRAFT_574565 [Laccaria amethystina LaAM-08-1]